MYQDNRKLDFLPVDKAIKKERETIGMTQEQLAQILDCSPRNIMYIENRCQHPRLNNFYRLLTLFNLSVDQFFYLNSLNTKSPIRNQIDLSLDTLTDKELIIIQSTLKGIVESREVTE